MPEPNINSVLEKGFVVRYISEETVAVLEASGADVEHCIGGRQGKQVLIRKMDPEHHLKQRNRRARRQTIAVPIGQITCRGGQYRICRQRRVANRRLDKANKIGAPCDFEAAFSDGV